MTNTAAIKLFSVGSVIGTSSVAECRIWRTKGTLQCTRWCGGFRCTKDFLAAKSADRNVVWWIW